MRDYVLRLSLSVVPCDACAPPWCASRHCGTRVMSHYASVQICDFYCEEEYDSVANSLLKAILEGQVSYKEVSWCSLIIYS